MTQTLAQLITSVQAQLIDDGTRFSTATCTAAIRSTLAKINKRIPRREESILDTVTDQREYEAVNALYITDVLQYLTASEAYPPLEYDAYESDNRTFFRLRDPLPSGLFILARYVQPHIVSGLDSEVESTLTADQDQVLIDGACAEAMSMRAASRIETINLQQQVSGNYKAAMTAFANAYEAGVKFYERRQGSPSLGRTTAWNDEYHEWTV